MLLEVIKLKIKSSNFLLAEITIQNYLKLSVPKYNFQ